MLKRKTIVKVKIRPLIHTLLITINLRYSVHTGVWLMKCFNLLFAILAAWLLDVSMLMLALSSKHS